MKLTLKEIRAAEEIVRCNNPNISQECLDEEVEEILADWQADAAEDAAMREDTPCLQSCDFWGTGEGCYHGIIG